MACQNTMGSENDNTNSTDLTNDSLKIRSVTPSGNLTADVAQEITIVVDYNLVSHENGELEVYFNSLSVDQWVGYIPTILVVNKGNGSHTYNVTIVPKNWSPAGEYSVIVSLSPYPHGSTWNTLAQDKKTLSIK